MISIPTNTEYIIADQPTLSDWVERLVLGKQMPKTYMGNLQIQECSWMKSGTIAFVDREGKVVGLIENIGKEPS